MNSSKALGALTMTSSKALKALTAYYTDSENEDADNCDETTMDLKSEEEEEVKEVAVNKEETDSDLPPEPAGKCPSELQEKISKMFSKIQNEGLDLNQEIQSNKAFRNPSMYEKLIDYCELNEFGTNYAPHIFDPFKWGKESFYDELAKVQDIEMAKREKENKNLKTKVSMNGSIILLFSKSRSDIIRHLFYHLVQRIFFVVDIFLN
jgi:hypothetical protein